MTCFRLARVVALLAIIASLSSLGDATAQTWAQPVPQAIPRYAFEINLNYSMHSFDAVEHVTVPNPAGQPLSELVFNVPAAHEVGTFLLHQVLIGEQPADFSLVGTTLTVTLPATLLPNDVVTVTLDLTVLPQRIDDGVESFAAANLGYTDDMLTAGYWYPMLAPYRAGQGWLLVPWHSIGDPFASESADYTATITVTPSVEIVAGGAVTREGNVWHFTLPRGRTFAFIASDRYRQMDVTLSGVTYSLYTFAEHAHLMPVTLQMIVRSAWLYNSLYGAYPYTSLRVAEVSGPWSMEFSGLVTLGFDEFANYNGTERNRLVRITAHEVSHQWWYSVVGNDQAREPWLDESLARYSELRYYEFYSPGDVWWWRSAVFSSAAPDRAVDAAIYDFYYHNSYISSIYNRGAVFLDALRAQMGEPAYNEFMRDWYQRGAFRLVTLGDFLSVLAEHAHPDVRPVMWQYLAGAPFDTWQVSDDRSTQPTWQKHSPE